MKIFVTGITGFIGAHFARAAIAAGHEVTCLVRSPKRLPADLRADGPGIKIFEGDLNRLETLEPAVRGCEAVFHFAGVLFGRAQSDYTRGNVDATRNMIEASIRGGAKEFVYISSAAASGPGTSHVFKNETDPTAPISLYGTSKLKGEQVVLEFKDQIQVTIVRPPIVYGPGDKDILKLIKLVKSGFALRPLGRTESGQKYYSLIYVSDLVRGVLAALGRKGPTGEIFNLVGPDSVSSNDLFSVIAEHLGVKVCRIPLPNFLVSTLGMGLGAVGEWLIPEGRLSRDKFREMIPDYWLFSGEKARRDLGFVPEFSYWNGMKATIGSLQGPSQKSVRS